MKSFFWIAIYYFLLTLIKVFNFLADLLLQSYFYVSLGDIKMGKPALVFRDNHEYDEWIVREFICTFQCNNQYLGKSEPGWLSVANFLFAD